MSSQASEFRSRLETLLGAYGLTADVAAHIEEKLVPITYEKGAVIFLRGSACDLLFWLVKGFVKLYLPHEDGTRTLVDLARPGDFLGFVSNQDSRGRRHLLEAHALTKCSVGLLTRDQISPILDKLDRKSMLQLLEQVNVAWSTMFERYVSFLTSPFRTRLEMVLTSLGARFGADDKRGTLVVPELSHEDLAEMIGSSRPMVSKLIGDMTKEGLLARGERRRFILLPKRSPSATTPAEVQSSVQWRSGSKRTVGARDDAGAPQSQPYLSRPYNGSHGTAFK
jgi:CRP/FNR family cyclic AMP-dependent transcriptional regulator